MNPPFRILVVDDFEPFRRFVRLSFLARPEYVIVGEAEDGVEAVAKAKDLQPDLILMDIGLPKLNGLDAAREIRSLVPDARILFVSLDSFSAAAEEALLIYGHGYVQKERADADLLPAIESVLNGRPYARVVTEKKENTSGNSRHEVQFYLDDTAFLDGASRFVANAMNAGNPAIVMATRSHQTGLIQRLKEHGFDIHDAIRKGTYVPIDAIEILSKVMVEGRPDPARFVEILGGAVRPSLHLSRTNPSRVAIFGECVGLLCTAGNTHGAVQIEKAGNEMLGTQSMDILCAYPLSAFQGPTGERDYIDICAEHSAVLFR